MKLRTKLILTYVFWALLLQQHPGAGQKIDAILSGKLNRIWSFSGYLAISLVVICVAVALCRPLKKSWPTISFAAFTAWFVALLSFWLCMMSIAHNINGETHFLLALFLFFILPHIVIPIAPLVVLCF